MVAIARHEPQPPRGVGELEAERVAITRESRLAVAGIDVDVAELARPVTLVGRVGMILDAADDSYVPAFRVLEAETVVAVRLAYSGRRIDGVEAVRHDLGMQAIDRRDIGGIEHHAEQGRLRRAA